MIDSDDGSLTGGGRSRVVLLDCEVTITAKAVTVGLWGEVDVVTAPLLHAVLTALITPSNPGRARTVAA